MSDEVIDASIQILIDKARENGEAALRIVRQRIEELEREYEGWKPIVDRMVADLEAARQREANLVKLLSQLEPT